MRGSKFWIVAGTAALLSVLSWVKLWIIQYLNTHLFSRQALASPGATLYVLLRLAIVTFLVWTVVRSPVQPSSAMSRPRSGSKRFDPLMGLRALACFIVLMGHYFMVVFPFPHNGVNPVAFTLLRSCAWAGVWVFFTLSGYLMGKGFMTGRYTLDEAGSRLFLRNRALRILPIYISSVILVSIYRYDAIFQARNLWMLGEVFLFDSRGELPINPIGALWSVSTEMQFYVLAPALACLLLHLFQRYGKGFLILPLALAAICTAGRWWMLHAHPSRMTILIYAPLIPNLDLFLAGMSINLLPRIRVKVSGWALAGSALAFYAAMSLLLQTYLHFHQPFQQVWVVGPALSLVFAALFIYFAEIHGTQAIMPGVRGRLLLGIQAIGTLTYCLYVFHPEIYMQYAALLPDFSFRSVMSALPMVMLQLLAVATFFYFTVEKPFDSQRK